MGGWGERKRENERAFYFQKQAETTKGSRLWAAEHKLVIGLSTVLVL